MSFATYTAYTDPTGTGYTESLRVVETLDAESSDQATAILSEAGYRVLDVVEHDVLVSRES